MASCRLALLCWGCSLLLLLGACKEEENQEEQKMVDALQEVLGKLRDEQLPYVEKKFSWGPSCDAGEQCAVRKGARIGRLCSCPPGPSCNLAILKCL